MPPFSFLNLIHPSDVQTATAQALSAQQAGDLAVAPSRVAALAPLMQGGIRAREAAQQATLAEGELQLAADIDRFNRAQIGPAIALGAVGGAVEVGRGLQARAAEREQRQMFERLGRLGEAAETQRQRLFAALMPLIQAQTRERRRFLSPATAGAFGRVMRQPFQHFAADF